MKRFPLLISFACTMACGSAPPAGAVADLGPIPTEETLCSLTPHASTTAEVRALLGTPTTSQTFADRSATFLYDYDAETAPSPTIAVLQFWFTTEQVFSTASVSNMAMPPCWSFDSDSGL